MDTSYQLSVRYNSTVHTVYHGHGRIKDPYNDTAVVIHAIAPIGEEDEALILCYQHSLELTLVHNIKTIVSPH